MLARFDNVQDPNDLLAQCVQTERTLAQQIESGLATIKALGEDRVGVTDFVQSLTELQGQLRFLSQAVDRYTRHPTMFGANRGHAKIAFQTFTNHVNDLKAVTNSAAQLMAESDKATISGIVKGLVDLLVSPQIGPAQPKPPPASDNVADSVRRHPRHGELLRRLQAVKEKFNGLQPPPSVAISFDFQDQQYADLFADILKHGLHDVRIITDTDRYGPASGRKIDQFQGDLGKVDYIVVIGTPRYGSKSGSSVRSGVRTEAEIVSDRYTKDAEHVVRVIADGTVESAFPAQMANSQKGYVSGSSGDRFLAAIAETVCRCLWAYSDRSRDPTNQRRYLLETLTADFMPPPR